ncbi:flagellar motor switch protein FliM [Candidatus Berkiella aquae]|uniref:Flagellar motor switch protein FliM n=1 Tax=Candidatus Berkiella aquae TaxID=295108 RepID=A0A0Q9YL68_9GAMM|nr:flagellar motor switch protein FliM [Candidatus Berkiella aquae]MCS5711416.1 flagellar motor switch protein FliM [Candidatus Berkiella aquae]
MNQILTQDEIDALLNFKENDYQDFERIDPSIPREFDLTNQEKSIQSKIISLGLINEKIARNVRNTLYHFLKKPVDIGISKIKIIHFSEYMKSLPIPSSVNIFKMSPLKGMSLFVFNSRLIYTFVESYFGGEGHTHFKSAKEFTPTENRIAKLLLENFYKDLKDAWSSVIDINFETKSTETNPSMITSFHDKEVFIVSKFKVEGTGGDFDICLPYSMIEPIKELFEAGIHAEHDKNNEKWGQLLKDHLLDVRIDVNCVLARKKVLLKEIMKFKDGDIINIAIPEEIVIKSADIPLFSGSFGTFDSKYAIKVNKKSK